MVTLSVKQLEKSFGPKKIFSGITFNQQSTVLGIAGSNGSGKSTFLKCLSGLLAPSRGNIQWKYNGSLLDPAAFKQKLGYAAPYINLYNELSCIENLQFVAKIRHQSDVHNAIDQWISKVGLSAVATQPFGKLSTGQQQRLRLASALFYDPEILLLDEPGSNLDEAGRELVRNIAETFRTDERMLLIASNNPNELQLCEKVFSIEDEQFIESFAGHLSN